MTKKQKRLILKVVESDRLMLEMMAEFERREIGMDIFWDLYADRRAELFGPITPPAAHESPAVG